MRLYFLIVGGLCCLAACSYDKEWQTATAPSADATRQFSLLLPSYMQPAPDNKLNPRAKLQYCNYYRNVYTVVLDQARSNPTDTSLRQYADRHVQEMAKTLIKPQQIDSATLQINGLNNIDLTITGDLGQLKDLRERIYYRLCFVESPSHYYQIVAWTWDSRRKNFAADLDSIVHSFREIR